MVDQRYQIFLILLVVRFLSPVKCVQCRAFKTLKCSSLIFLFEIYNWSSSYIPKFHSRNGIVLCLWFLIKFCILRSKLQEIYLGFFLAKKNERSIQKVGNNSEYVILNSYQKLSYYREEKVTLPFKICYSIRF